MPGIIIRVLVEDTARQRGLAGEHGLALLVRTDTETVLFDTGQSGLFLENAATLEEDISSVMRVVLSHGHYDHAGGLSALADKIGSFTVYAHPRALEEKTVTRGTKQVHIGFAEELPRLRERGVKFSLSARPVSLAGGWVTGYIERSHPGDENLIPSCLDPIEDSQALVLPTREGIVIITGCAHAGLINIIDAARNISGESRIRALIGGFHLLSASEERMAEVIHYLETLDIDLIAPCHCTGIRAQVDLLRAFPGRTQCPVTGSRIVIE